VGLIKKLNKIGNRNKAIDGFSSKNRQTDKENKSRVRTVLEDIHQS